MERDEEFERKKLAALAALQAKFPETDWQYLQNWPPILRVQWALGLNTKPTYFNSLVGESVQGLFKYGVLLVLAIVWGYSHGAVLSLIGLVLLFFGLSYLTALRIRSFARKKQLPSWESL